MLNEVNVENFQADRHTSALPAEEPYKYTHGTAMNEALQPLSMTMEMERALRNDRKEKRKAERAIFHKARWLLHQHMFYRWIVYLYAERKMLVFFMVHFVCTMTIWAHFALVKFETQTSTVPDGANRYWWKILAPTLEFGSMHAILFQLALIPLTMSRLSIAALSETFVAKIIPLNRALRMHIHLGYTMITIVFLSTIFFFIFFGILCSDGEKSFCLQFTSEIMITGYAILVSSLLIGGTSYFRHHIPYEIFYAIHHMVFIMYFITIAHTFDVNQRKGIKNRSQTFKWFTAPLLYYICDRAAMHLNHKYRTKLVDSKAGASTHDDGDEDAGRMLILTILRPVLFRFQPGQYAYLRISKLDNQFHPFSIASGPESTVLEFYIEVCDKTSWTKKLWDLLEARRQDITSRDLQLDVEVMGPYGASLTKTTDYSHVLAFGAGTGIVPVLSLFKQHITQMSQLQPGVYLKERQNRENQLLQMDLAADSRKGSLFKKLIMFCTGSQVPKHDIRLTTTAAATTRSDQRTASLQTSIRYHETLEDTQARQINLSEMHAAVSRTTRSVYGIVWLAWMPVLGVTVMALTISWNTIAIDLYPNMTKILLGLTFLFQTIFASITLFVWDSGTGISSYIDLCVCLVTPFANWYWFKMYYNEHKVLHPGDIVLSILLTAYMTARAWMKAVLPRHGTVRRYGGDNCHSWHALDRLDVVWTTRSATLVANVLPSIVEYWDKLVAAWGVELATEVCRITIHITSDLGKDAFMALLLKEKFHDSDLVRRGAIQFHRVKLFKLIEDHTLDLIGTRRRSSTLLVFCGSPELGQEVHCHKLSNDMVTIITGNNKRHSMDFVAETHGGIPKRNQTTKKANAKDSTPTNNTTRKLFSVPRNSNVDSSTRHHWVSEVPADHDHHHDHSDGSALDLSPPHATSGS